MKHIPSNLLVLDRIPRDGAGLEEMIRFAHSYDSYEAQGSFEACAQLANTADHITIDRLRTCLFFEARRWRHFGEAPDVDALTYWRWLVAEIRHRLAVIDGLLASELAEAIQPLPADEPVALGTPGYNRYATQKAHWLGWLDPLSGTGTYPRNVSDPDLARTVYNQIGEPKMMLWLARAAGADERDLAAADVAISQAPSMRGQCGAVRRVLPWRRVGELLLTERFSSRSYPKGTSVADTVITK